MTSKKTDMPGDLESIESVSSESSSSEEEESSSESESSGSSTGSSFDDSDESGSDDDDSENRDETEEINKMIRKESKDVIMWREIVTAMLVITAALATITTYVFLTREQGDDFTNGVSVFLNSKIPVVNSHHLTILTSYANFRNVSVIFSSLKCPCVYKRP